jgi:cobalt-zinc-cadmium efflux system outer membrane protein
MKMKRVQTAITDHTKEERIMRISGMALLLTALWLWLTTASLKAEPAQMQEGNTASGTESALSMEILEKMALENNPTLAQAGAEVDSAEGRRIQAGLYPNPIIGYSGEEISVNDPSDRAIHSIFAEQTVVTAGKLRKSTEIFTKEATQAAEQLEAQRRRVLTDVRVVFYQALGAQKMVDIRSELAGIAQEAVETTRQLFNVGQADQPDVLEAEMLAQKTEIELMHAETELERVWRVLASVVGKPDSPRMELAGDLSEEPPRMEEETLLTKLLQESPQIKSARAGVERAEAAVTRALAGRYPDVTFGTGYTYNAEPDESQVLFYVRVPIPLFDGNQGNIASSKAERNRAEEEIRRVELSIRSELASVFANYRNALYMTERYQKTILPKAQEAYQLYLQRFRQQAASYPQVLIAQRNLFQSRVEYVRSLADLWQNTAVMEGFLLTGSLDQPPSPPAGALSGPIPTTHGVRLGR